MRYESGASFTSISRQLDSTPSAIQRALTLGDHIKSVHDAKGVDYEIELSVDETDQPTTLAEHYIIADQCLHGGMKLVSLAPRFIGDFESEEQVKETPSPLLS